MADQRFRRMRFATVAAACLTFALLGSCGGDDGNSQSPPIGNSPTQTPTPTATLTPSVSYIATPAPFGLTGDAAFEVLGRYLTGPSEMQIRWNSTASVFEIIADGRTQWAQLKLRNDGKGSNFDAFAQDGSILPLKVEMFFNFGPAAEPYKVGDIRVIEDGVWATWAIFGQATPASFVPASGTLTCEFGMDEVGDGQVLIDFAANTATGKVVNFWGPGRTTPVYMSLNDAAIRPSASIDLTATFGTNPANILEARFYGPEAHDIVIRSKGDVSGLMVGKCTS